MKKLLKSSVLMLLVLCTVLSVFQVNASEGSPGDGETNRYNVVFVTDASGSMLDTDPDGYRFEAIQLFISLLSNGGNNVGSVVFSTDILATHDIIEVNNRSDKNSLMDNIQSVPAKGWTNTGAALLKAVDMLDRNADSTIPSIIILLTDGVIEMGDAELTAKSIADKEDALEAAREKGYQIYTVSLNCDQNANSDEMRQIANATGGAFREVTTASDLQSVFDVYYQMIYDTQSIKLVDETVPESGIISRDFSVASLGINEVNVVMFGSINSCRLKRPTGSDVKPSELNEILYEAKTFTMIKLVDPESGNWNLTVDAEPGSVIKIFKIYNPDFSITGSQVDPKDTYKLGDEIKFITKIKEDNVVINDTSKYVGYTASLIVNDYEGNQVFRQDLKTATAEGFEHTFIPEKYGTYYATISVETEELYDRTGNFVINVGNTPPYAENETVEWHIYRWPFLFKTDATLDLNGNAFDGEDSELVYSIKSSTWLDEDFTLDGTLLTIDNFTVSKGSFTVEARDSLGAYCSFDVKVTSTNVGLWVVILILVAGLITLIVVGIVTYRQLLVPFMGSFTVENMQTGLSATRQKSRGRLNLSTFGVGGIDKKARVYFQATGKNFVYIKSSIPFYSDLYLKKTKKMRLDSGMDVKISLTDDFEKSVMIRFESLLDNNNLF